MNTSNPNLKIPKTNSRLAVTIYIVIAIATLWAGNSASVSLINKIVYFNLGLLFFTLIEYLMHRFLYHSGPDYKDERYWQYKVHGVHHEFPTDTGLLALPIPIAILLGAVFFGIFYLLLGEVTYSFWPGFFIGYASYLRIHYLVHSRKPPKNFLKYLWRHHHLHHYQYEDKAYGVSSPLWDFVFGTLPPQDLRKKR